MSELVTNHQTLDLDDLCQKCNIMPQHIISYIEEGFVQVEGENPADWRFSHLTSVRISKAVRLEQDLRLNPAGALLALELLEEIEQLKQKLRRYEPHN